MKSIPITCLTLSCIVLMSAISGLAQSFEGTITYAQDIDLSASFKKMGITKEMMMKELGKKGDWFDTVRISYRQGDYAMIGNNANKLTKIYKSSENIIYSFNAKGSQDICSVQNAVDLTMDGKPDKPVITMPDTIVTILGKRCQIIRMKWKMSEADYYYSALLATINPDLFSKHSSEGFADFVKMAKCLPLQKVISAAGIMIIQTATEIKPGKVSPELFAIPTLVEDESLNMMKIPGVKAMRVKR